MHPQLIIPEIPGPHRGVEKREKERQETKQNKNH